MVAPQTTIYLVRHGESDGNTHGFFQGCSDCALSQNGFLQLEALKKRFEHIPFDIIYSSPLQRAMLTAEAVNFYHKRPLVFSDGLIEINGGVFEGLSWDEIEEKYPSEFAIWRDNACDFHAPKSESMEHVFNRMRDTVLYIIQQNLGKTIVLVSHGCAIKNFFCYVMGLPLSSLEKAPWVDNTSISKVTFSQGELKLVFANDTEHLEKLDLKKPKYWNRADGKKQTLN